MGKTRKIGSGFEICETFLLCERTVRRGCEIPTCSAAMLPATEPHRDVTRKATFFSVRRAVSPRIQNTRSHIPLCLQFLYTTEGNKRYYCNMVTIPWCSKRMRNIIAHVALQLETIRISLTCCWKNTCLMFLHLMKKKRILLCAVLFTSEELK